MQKILDGQNLEVTLQRTLLPLLADIQPGCWFNEFAVSAGVVGGVRSAVDIVHTSADKTVWDFIELKEWDAADDPHEVAFQVLGYFFSLSALVERQVSPYNECCPREVRLWIMAPQAHFDRFGGIDAYRSKVIGVAAATDRLLKTRPEMLKVTFDSSPLVLDSTVLKRDFLGMFERAKVESFVQQQTAVESPLKLLLPNQLRVALMGESSRKPH